MRRLYTFLFYLLLPGIFLRLFYRSLKSPRYRQRLGERLGFFSGPDHSKNMKTLWVHAVSVGEVIAAIPIIKALQRRYPEYLIVVTTMTITGSERVLASLGDQVFHVYVPYDVPSAIKRFLDRIQPQLLIIIETELWPNTLFICRERHIPIILANARLSQKSANGYAHFSRFTRDILATLSVIAAQSQEDANRFVALGADVKKVEITGSVKFDITVPGEIDSKAQSLREAWGKTRAVWIAASTHEGEEQIVLEAFKHLHSKMPSLLLILVPRHPERFIHVANLCRAQGFATVLRSDNQACDANTEIYLGDTMGELLLLLAASDVVFMGGSLVSVGGHNLIEAAVLGKPVLTGPYMFNFSQVNKLLQESGGVFPINNAPEMAQKILQLLEDETLRVTAGQNGQAVVAKNRGALAKHLALVEKVLSEL